MTWDSFIPEWLKPSEPDPNAEPEPGTLTKAFSNPWIAGAYGLGSGLLSAAWPQSGAGAKIAHGIGKGLEFGLEGEKGTYERAKKQRMSEALKGMIGAKTPTVDTGRPSTVYAPNTGGDALDIGPDGLPIPKPYTPMSEQRLSEVVSGIPTAKTGGKPQFTPQQQAILNAAVEGGQQDVAFKALAAQAFKEQKQPLVVRPGGAIWDPDTGTFSAQLPGLPKEATFRPYQIDLGDKVESGQVNSATGEKIGVITTPKGSAPAREVTPEGKAKIAAETERAKAQAGHASALAERARNAAKLANDPNTAKEKLATELAVALRDQKNARDAGDEEGAASATVVVNELRQALARRAKDRNAGEVMEKMPDAKAHKGKIIRDTNTGERLQSDGKNWVPVKGGREY